MPEFYAHSANAQGEGHDLVHHLEDSAERARRFGDPFGAAEVAGWLAGCHDIGKFSSAFQSYLRKPERSRGPDHSSAGAVLAERLGPFAGLIAGHHGGIPGSQNLRDRLKRAKNLPVVTEALEIAAKEIANLEPDSSLFEGLPDWLPRSSLSGPKGLEGKRRWEVFLRFVFSALTDADFLDTESHFDSYKTDARSQADWAVTEFWGLFEAKHRKMVAGAEPTELNGLREEIYEHCLAAAANAPGFYRLTVPTGGGKTLSGMGFALRHAVENDLKRIVVAIPYTSIIDQTADTYREIFHDAVLEHHSAVSSTTTETSSPIDWQALWPRLASENWDAPIIATTTVQLFESLFSNRPASCRKLHNLVGSVVILDEAQTLPPHLLEPILDVLRELVENYKVTVVLSTATQPTVAIEPYSHMFATAHEIVPEPGRYFDALRRVRYDVRVGKELWSWSRTAEEMRTTDQCLVVVNTKRDALALLQTLDDPAALHLSTNLCAAHRKRVLAEVRRRLEAGERCLLVSTQVVEAGVDIDFPLVLRALGPLDRIVQAAGRCNREGKLGKEGGRVVIFEPEESGMLPLGGYRVGTAVARTLLAEKPNLHDPVVYERYFLRFSAQVELDQRAIQGARARWDFPEVAERFRLIDDDSIPVFVPDQEAPEIESEIDRVRHGHGSPRHLFRRLQPFVVNARRRTAEIYVARGLAEEVVPGLLRWWGRYDGVLGLIEDPGITPAQLIQ